MVEPSRRFFGRAVLLGVLAAFAMLLLPRGAPAIVGGTQISIAQAPWQVVVTATTGSGGLLCGGAILDSTHVLTAAHCAFDPAAVPPSAFTVLAGTSDFESAEATEQARAVQSLRTHPYFVNSSGGGRVNPDDVAVLELAKPFEFNSLVAPIALPAAESALAEGSAVELTGFGQQLPGAETVDGKLYALSLTLGFSRECGGENDALLLCAGAPGGSPCNGDSGSALTTPGASPTVVGVEDAYLLVGGQRCAAGARNAFANLAAPEIRDFLQGSDTPPRAPRGGGAGCDAVAPIVANTMTCHAGAWSNAPSFTYLFVDSSSALILQSGPSPIHQFAAGDVGRTIYFEVRAANAGGTGVGRTNSTSPVAAPAVAVTIAAPSLSAGSVTLDGAGLAVRRGIAVVHLACVGTARCTGKLSLSVKVPVGGHGKRHLRSITIATAKFSIALAKTTAVKLRLTPTGRSLLRRGHGHLKALLGILKLTPGPPERLASKVSLATAAPLRARSR